MGCVQEHFPSYVVADSTILLSASGRLWPREREPYIAENAQARTNIDVTNIRDDKFVKVLFVECKALSARLRGLRLRLRRSGSRQRPNWKGIC